MKIKSIHRRHLLAGGVASTLLAALPLSSQTAQSKTLANRPKSLKKKPLVTGIKAAQLPLQSFAHMVYSRLGYGITSGEFDEASWAAIAGDDDATKLKNFVNIQLANGTDVDVQDRINQAGNFTTLNKSLTQMWNDHRLNPGSGVNSYNRPIYEMKRLKFTRAAYSLFPLKERIADFWHDHFSLNGDDQYARATMTSWDRDVIRGHMLGNFHEFLRATAQHPAMLYYLDNYNNSSSEPNENYARELIELHTLGVENYYGLAQPSEVPTIAVTDTGGAWPVFRSGICRSQCSAESPLGVGAPASAGDSRHRRSHPPACARGASGGRQEFLTSRASAKCCVIYWVPGDSIRAAVLAGTEDDAALGKVIGGELYGDLVAGQNADVILAHFSGNVGSHNMPIFQLHPEQCVGQGIDDSALHLNVLFFCHALPRFSGIQPDLARLAR